MPVFRSGNSFSDSPFGPNGERLTTAIRSLTVGNRRRVTGRRLDPSGEPAEIGPERTTVPRRVEDPSTSGGGGWISPIVQQKYTGATYYTEVSSDGLWTWEFGHEVTLIDDDGAGDTYVLKLDDPNTPAP